jgi:MFS transporter, PAT family, beta-lactamase induction signal transducer AmpG
LAFGVETFASFFRKEGIVAAVLFILFYRFAENQLVKLIAPFLLDPRAEGGLGLTNEQYGFAKGTVGVLALVIGGLLGGASISRWGLRACLWPMVAIMHLPDLVFVYLSWALPTSYPLIVALVGVEQFGYGFGFTAYMMFLIRLADGPYKTAHYAIATGLMALSVTLTGMFTGALQERIGYQWFFLWVVVSIVPGVIVAAMVKIEPGFGKATG